MLPAVIVIVLWQGASLLFGGYWVPPPSTVALRFVTGMASEDMLTHALYTSYGAVLGFILGGVPGVLLPFLLRQKPLVAAILEPFMTGGYALPKLALTPLLLVWFGIGMGSKLALVALSAFFILYFNSIAGVRAVEPKLIHMARVMGATEWHIARHLVLPSAVPYIVAAVRVAWPYAVGGAVVAELLSANRGLGYVIQLGTTSFDTAAVFAALVSIGLVVLAGNVMVNRVEQRFLRWRPASAQGGAADAR